jgi:quercetin dioxygenase-like cupin family protein
MRRAQVASVVVVVALCIGSAVAQTPGTRAGALVLNPTGPTSGIGISNAALIDRAEIRVLRVDVAPGGVRNVHSHDDMQYHIFIPTAAGMRFQAGSEQPVALADWQAQFVAGGTKHGFTNTGASPVTVMEIFVKRQ